MEAKRKLNDYQFYGKTLEVSYAPQYETLEETIYKLELRQKMVAERRKPNYFLEDLPKETKPLQINRSKMTSIPEWAPKPEDLESTRIATENYLKFAKPVGRDSLPSDKFKEKTLDEKVKAVREKLNKVLFIDH